MVNQLVLRTAKGALCLVIVQFMSYSCKKNYQFTSYGGIRPLTSKPIKTKENTTSLIDTNFLYISQPELVSSGPSSRWIVDLYQFNRDGSLLFQPSSSVKRLDSTAKTLNSETVYSHGKYEIKKGRKKYYIHIEAFIYYPDDGMGGIVPSMGDIIGDTILMNGMTGQYLRKSKYPVNR